MKSLTRYVFILIAGLMSISFLLTSVMQPAYSASDKYCQWTAKNFSINEPLCGLNGNAESGRKLVINRKKGNCLACHMMPIPEQDFHGNIAPPLFGVGARHQAGNLRIRLVDIKQINPASLMPGFYKHPDKLVNVSNKFQGKTPLSAQEVEDVVAYLLTLK